MKNNVVTPAKAGDQVPNFRLKNWIPAFAGMTTIWAVMSVVVHAGVGGGFYYWFAVRQPAPIVAELDLSMTPLSPVVPNAGGGYGAKPADTWRATKKSNAVPAPVAGPAVVETKEEILQETPGTGNGWGGGTGEGEGQYIPAEAASRKPRWVRNFITAADYPLIARQEGKDGRVVLSVLIDADGRVRDARLLQGSYEMLNEVALRKVKDAVFSPAYNAENKPVSCKVTLPIRFELR